MLYFKDDLQSIRKLDDITINLLKERFGEIEDDIAFLKTEIQHARTYLKRHTDKTHKRKMYKIFWSK